MDQRHIDVFVAVMRLGSVTAAAEALAMSQPSVSKVIALTERRLGYSLFTRVRGRLEPTPEASLVLDEALRLQENVARFERFLVNVRDFREGQLRVAATPALTISLLPTAAKHFRSHHPRYGLVLDMQLNHEIAQSVANEEYDVGLLVAPTDEESHQMQALHRGSIVCLTPAQCELNASEEIGWDDLSSEQLIHITTDKRIVSHMTMRIPDYSRRASSSLECNRYATAVGLVAQGLGVTLVDEFTLIGHPLQGVKVHPFVPRIPVSLVAIIGRRHSKTRAAEKFIELTRAIVEGEIKRIFA